MTIVCHQKTCYLLFAFCFLILSLQREGRGTVVVMASEEEKEEEKEKTPNELLWDACTSPRETDSVEDIQSAIAAGADINFQHEKTKQTCLMSVTLRGKPKILRYLLQNGADVTLAERQGFTPPHGAGFQGRLETMKILVEEANLDVINIRHEDGFKPLHRACWGKNKRHTEVVEYLISKGADFNEKGTGDKKESCFEMTKNPDTIALLKKYGAEEPKEEEGNDEL
eukprot:CAMPEP_0194184114 /NCGR_PEP_ID=MMETSP0154-20130528/35855_1 /TAXON_ID=1049557 /ORGANISM="Thalassiothrix antarctica, Strain L6-D1" /LENGTH=225 /DNA_ID=CAMNT_0038901519 /DNA_START=8 /DNA_END=685 /DNA_ORIENTATION=+